MPFEKTEKRTTKRDKTEGRKEVRGANEQAEETKQEEGGRRVPGACFSSVNGENGACSHCSLATNQPLVSVCRGEAHQFTLGLRKPSALSQPRQTTLTTHTHPQGGNAPLKATKRSNYNS